MLICCHIAILAYIKYKYGNSKFQLVFWPRANPKYVLESGQPGATFATRVWFLATIGAEIAYFSPTLLCILGGGGRGLSQQIYSQNLSTQGRRADKNPVTIMSFSPHPLENSSACTYKRMREREFWREQSVRERERERGGGARERIIDGENESVWEREWMGEIELWKEQR